MISRRGLPIIPLNEKGNGPVPCFECGQQAAVLHHVVPRSRGGTKTVPLCYACHELAHEISYATLNGRALGVATKAGIVSLYRDGYSFREIEEMTGKRPRTVKRVVMEAGLEIRKPG